jgi:hypothetical protein
VVEAPERASPPAEPAGAKGIAVPAAPGSSSEAADAVSPLLGARVGEAGPRNSVGTAIRDIVDDTARLVRVVVEPTPDGALAATAAIRGWK